jgi:flavodoxin
MSRIKLWAQFKLLQRQTKKEEKMKRLFCLLFGLILFCMEVQVELQAQTQPGSRILVAYFSWSGNAKVLAGQIAQETGGDLFEIKTVTPYPEGWNECITLAREEQNRNARPALSGSVSNMAQYGTIILCYPNWWGTLPMALFTFFEAYDFSGKTIYPLITHGGSRFGRSLDDMKRLCPQTTIGEGLDILAYDRNFADGPMVRAPNRDVSSWLRRIGMAR